MPASTCGQSTSPGSISAIAECARILKPGGVLLVTAPTLIRVDDEGGLDGDSATAPIRFRLWDGYELSPPTDRPIATIEKNGVLSKAFYTPEHLGTHLDAPRHFADLRVKSISSRMSPNALRKRSISSSR